MEIQIRLIAFFILLLLAALLDMKNRVIPDSICLLIAASSLIPVEPCRMAGVLAALPLFLAGMTIGGIGGGDIKIVGASGMVLGFMQTSAGLFLALLLLIVFHEGLRLVHKIRQKQRKENREQKEEQAYPLVPFLFLGMLIVQFM